MEQPPLSASGKKLRVMCSYGGRILPRQHTKSLYYAGGDTRIVAVPAAQNGVLSLSAFVSHLAATLHLSYPFTLKYQLPNHDLDSLVSVSTDEDFLAMLEEHRLLSAVPDRIRLFLCASSQGTGVKQNSELKHPKRESFFVDALKGIVVGGTDSIVLETSSSFGSTSSSASPSSLPVKSPVEDYVNGFTCKKTQMAHPELSSCDNVALASRYYALPVNFEDASENSNISGNPFESGSNIFHYSPPFDVQRISPMPGQFFPTSQPYYLSYNHAFVPLSSCYPYHQHQIPATYHVPDGKTYEIPFTKPGNSVPASSLPEVHSNGYGELPLVSVSDASPESDVDDGHQGHESNEQLDDPAVIQIYKSQPPPPELLSGFQNGSKSSRLTERLEQLKLENSGQHVRTPSSSAMNV